MRSQLARRTATGVALGVFVLSACTSPDRAVEEVPDRPTISEVACDAPPRSPRLKPTVDPPAELPTALVVENIANGTGRAAEPGDTLYVDYVGIRSADGTEFDSTYLRGRPLNFVLDRGDVVRGWDLGMLGATAGTVRRLDIPADLAYGDSPVGDVVQPGDALTFVIEVRAVIAPTSADDAPLELDVAASTDATEVTTLDIVDGDVDGAAVQIGDTALVHMMLVRGDNKAVLVSTWESNDPLEIVMDAESPAIPGMVQGLQCARVGGQRVITMPPEWAFGQAGQPTQGLPADTDVIIVVEILGIV